MVKKKTNESIELNSGETVELLEIDNLTIEKAWFSDSEFVSLDVSFENNGLQMVGLICPTDMFWHILATIEEQRNEDVIDTVLNELSELRKQEDLAVCVDIEYLFDEPLIIEDITLTIYAIEKDSYFAYDFSDNEEL